MKDFLDKELQIEDIVVTTSSKYENLQVAVIKKFTPKMVVVQILESLNYLNRPGKTCRKFGTQVVKIDNYKQEEK